MMCEDLQNSSTENPGVIRAYYDGVAGLYDTKHGLRSRGQAYNWKKYYEPFLDVHVPLKGTVLELGCGTGVYTSWLCKRGLRVTAMDVSPNMIELARKRSPEAEFLVGDCQDPAASLDTESVEKKFDTIVGINTFSYYIDKRRALSNYFSLLRKSGKFIIIDMNGKCPAFKWSQIRNINEMRIWYHVVRECNRKNLRRMLDETGFRIERLGLFSFVPNMAGTPAVTLLSPVDAILSRLPFVDAIAIRIGVVARKP